MSRICRSAPSWAPDPCSPPGSIAPVMGELPPNGCFLLRCEPGDRHLRPEPAELVTEGPSFSASRPFLSASLTPPPPTAYFSIRSPRERHMNTHRAALSTARTGTNTPPKSSLKRGRGDRSCPCSSHPSQMRCSASSRTLLGTIFWMVTRFWRGFDKSVSPQREVL